MSCKQFRHNALQQSNWPVQVSGLQIINGGQTSRTVEQIVQEVGPEVGSAQVLVRIYELPDGDDDLVSQITYATNSQNPVDLRDLRANDDRQKALALSIGELGFEYRTKRDDRAVTPKELTSSVVPRRFWRSGANAPIKRVFCPASISIRSMILYFQKILMEHRQLSQRFSGASLKISANVHRKTRRISFPMPPASSRCRWDNTCWKNLA